MFSSKPGVGHTEKYIDFVVYMISNAVNRLSFDSTTCGWAPNSTFNGNVSGMPIEYKSIILELEDNRINNYIFGTCL